MENSTAMISNPCYCLDKMSVLKQTERFFDILKKLDCHIVLIIYGDCLEFHQGIQVN